MSKGNPEIRLFMKILAVAGFVVLLLLLGGYLFVRLKAPHMLVFGENIQESRLEIELDSLKRARFIGGMSGCENLWLDPSSQAVFVTTLDGYIHFVDMGTADSLLVMESYKAGSTVSGICMTPDSLLAAVVNSNTREEWMEKGASVCLLPSSLDSLQKISKDYPSANGICCDNDGNLYLASSNFDFLDPFGNIFFLEQDSAKAYLDPVPLFEDVGLANGVYFDQKRQRIYFSTTLGDVFSFAPNDRTLRLEYRKIRFMEACDDLCTDPAGNLWMTDPGYSTVKVFNPGTGRLTRFVIKGIGQTSSCRIRTENGMEILYVTELKKDQRPFSGEFDGRGMLRIPVNDLLERIPAEPLTLVP